ncbi:MAG: type I polyketide synthase [Kibdelosporangium sp.]
MILGLDPLAGLAALGEVPSVVIAPCPLPGGDVPTAVRAVTGNVLELLQTWLADPRFESAKLVVVTHERDLVAAPVWGLVRAAQAEHPGRMALVDWDGIEEAGLLAAAGSAEPELSVRGTTVSVPRLVNVSGTSAGMNSGSPWDPDGTVLITGGTGGLGTIIARHLAEQHGVRHVLLASRTVGGDVTDRQALADLIASIPADRPLRAVIHAAGVMDSARIDTMTPDQLEAVLKPKVDGAWNLHELTKGIDLTAFVLLSSAGGLVLPTGQGNYAAANVFLDALATHREAMGLPATSMAFGMWAVDTGLGDVTAADLARMSRLGMPALSAQEGIELFDAATRAGEAVVVPLKVDPAALRANEVPALLRGLLPASRPVAHSDVADMTENELLALVNGHVAAVLGHESAVEADRAFKDLGIDSMAATELRDRLNTATGMRLPVTLAFDHPSVRSVADYIAGHVATGHVATGHVTAGHVTAGHVEAAAPAPADDPIAIVAMSCRFPGGVRSPEELWQLVADGKDVISAFPADRGWDVERIYDPEGGPNKTYTRQGGFLYDATEFDPAFFGIAPREAVAMDPQQRLLLEAAWEAFERAGIDPTSMRGTQTGVYAGVMYHDYGTRMANVPEDVAGYLGQGSAGSIASGRVAYTLGLEGPAVTVDTACSSSLVALHMACQALRSGEVGMALAGGVTVMPTPEIFVEFSQQLGLAADGRCKAFAASADGTGWSEGVGLLLVERLSDARRNGHEVLAVIRGSAINQDGASNGLTAPNGPAQQRVIQRALAAAGLEPSDVDAVEGHGTGTVLGDPIEARALLETYGRDRAEPLWLGSVKSNIGHAQAAAGVSGVIKMIMAIRHGRLPRTLHVDEPTAEIDWRSSSVRLLTEAQPWRENGRPRRAAVSSFGLSGTNAHVILEQAPSVPVADTPAVSRIPVVPLVVSAADEHALSKQAERLAERLAADPELSLLDVAYSLATSRAALPYRAVIPATNREVALRGLAALVEGRPAGGVVRGLVEPGWSTAFLFTGQGAQRTGMGRELHAVFPVFAKAFDAVAAELDKHLDLPLKDVIWGESEGMANQTVFAQAGLFAVEVALYRLVESWGIEPDYLAGHSIGELSAAYLAEVWSLADAAKLVAARGRLMQALPGGGAMVAIQATETEIRPLLSANVTIAAVNGPSSVVISGATDEVTALARHFAGEDRKAVRLRVSHAFHSPLMDPMLEAFRDVAASLAYGRPQVRIVSAMTGQLAEDLDTPEYWVRQLRETVRFSDGVHCLSAAGVTRFVELGPDAVLAGLVDAPAVAVMRKDRDEVATLVTALAQLHVSGLTPDWRAYFAEQGARRVDLPTYAFQRQRYWLDPSSILGGDAAGLGQIAARHPLLSAVVPSAEFDAPMLTGRLSLETHPWLADHAVLGKVVLPGAGHVEMALRAGHEVGCDALEELIQEAPLPIPERGGVAVQVVVGPEESGRRTVSVYSRPDDVWVRNARGVLTSQMPVAKFNLRAWPPAGAKSVDVSGLYDDLAAVGYDYGPMFRGLRAVWRRGDDIFAEITSLGTDVSSCGVHPALLDAALHASRLFDGDQERTAVPFAWNGVRLYAAGAATLRVRLSKSGPNGLRLAIADPTGQPVATIESLTMREAAGQSDSLYRIAWQAVQPPAGRAVQAFVVQTGQEQVLAGVRSVVGKVLAKIRAWLAEEATAPLAIVTCNAVSVEPGETVDLRQAPVWGLVRAAQAEHPGRFILVDTDGMVDTDGSVDTDGRAKLAIAAHEPELAIRRGAILVPRLVKAAAAIGDLPWTADDTVLITGGTGMLGSRVARHLVTEHGVRNLVLASRRGIDSPGAQGLRDDLTALGAEVRISAVDVSDRRALAGLLAGIPRLTGIVHAAGVLDNALVEVLTADQVDRVLAAKADSAWHLHELTKHLDLSAFVLYSSAGGMVLAAGQANYAAANVFLDALAEHRRRVGLPAMSLAWGRWQDLELPEADLRRMNRMGLPELSFMDGLALLDRAMTTDSAVLVPMRVDLPALRARTDDVPTLLRGLARVKTASRATVDFTGMSEAERGRAVLELVRTHVAAVLGHDMTASIEPGRGFTELGLDSLAAVELRNRLRSATGLRLPATLMYDYPNCLALKAFLMSELEPAAPVMELDDGAIRAKLASISLDRIRDAGVLEMLLDMADLPAPPPPESGPPAYRVDELDIDELVRAVFESDDDELED